MANGWSWENDFFKKVSKKAYGNTYDEKLKNTENALGRTEGQTRMFQDYMDSLAPNRPKRIRQSDFKDINTLSKWDAEIAAADKKRKEKEQAAKKKKQAQQKNLIPAVKKKKDEPFLTDVKDFFTGKDTNGDGQRDGLYGFLDRYVLPISQAADEVLLPGNEAQQRKNELEKYGKIVNPATKAGMVDRGTETKVLHGLGTTLGYVSPMGESYKVVDFGLTKLPKAAQLLSNPIVNRAVKGAVASGLAETGLAAENELVNPDAANMKDYATRIGISTVAGGVLDPAMYLAGVGIKKGTEKYVESTMKNILPNKEEVQKAIQQLAKTEKGNYALPNGKGVTPAELQNLIPKGNNITDPNFVASLNPVIKPKVEAPKVLPTAEEIINAQKELPKVAEAPKIQQQQQEIIKQATQQTELPMNVNTPKQPQNVLQSPLQRPENIPYIEGERKHYSTLANSEKAPNEFVDGIKNLDRRIANTISDKDAADFANGLVNRDMEEAIQFVKNAEIRDKRHTVTGFRVIDELNKRGEFEKAVDMADILAKEGTKFGQGLQGFSVYNRLTPEGVLVRAQRTITKANATLPADKQIIMTPKIAEDLVSAADSIQRLTGQQEIGNNVISLLEKSKKGTKLTDAELKTVRSFMADAKKYIGDVDPNVKPPKIKPIKEVRTRDKIVDFMDKREQHAREELRKIMGRANALPVDAFYYLAEIGASKIAKGAVKFADFSEQMYKDFGEEIKPYMQQLYNKAVETFNITSDKITPKRLSQAEKLVNKALEDQTLNPDTADELIRLTKQLLNASSDAKLEASMNLQMVLNKLEQPTFAQMISSAHYQAMLLNPLTMVRNIIGNEIAYMAEQTSKLTAIPIDWATSKITGAPRTTVFRWNDFINPIKDYGKGFKIGGKAGWNGVSPFGINSAYDIKSLAFSSEAQNMNWAKKALVSKANPLHWTEKMLGAMMKSFDTAGYMRAYNQSLRDQALVKAMNEGLKGQALRNAAEQYFRQADENMIAMADHYGKYLTFQDNSALGKGMTVAKEKLNELSTYAVTLGLGKTKEYGLGNFIIPFPKTPANLIMRAIEYSPAGLLRSVNLLKNYLRVDKNPMVAREAQLALSRAIIGTFGFSYLGYILADKGVLTSSGNSDYNVRELEKMAGKQGNSVNVSALQRFVFGGFNMNDLDMRKGDNLVSYDWAQPISISLSLGTGVNQSYKEAKNPTFTDRLVNAGDSAANTIINMSSLAGINRLVSGPPNEGWSEKIAGTLASAGGSFVPTLLNQFRKVNDNTARNTNDPTFGEKFVNGAQNRVPGWEKKLPASYNPFGEKKELYPNKSNNLFNIFLNPSYVNKYNPTKEEKFLLDYINKTGDKSVAPNVAPKTIKVMGKDKKLSETVKMTGEEQSKYQRIYGQYFKKALQNELPYLMNADQKEIEDTLDKISREAGGEARNAIREGRK